MHVVLCAAMDQRTLFARPPINGEMSPRDPTLHLSAGATPQPARLKRGAWRGLATLHTGESSERVVLSGQAPDGTPEAVELLFLPGCENRRLPGPPDPLEPDRLVWSRSMGALGADVWVRLQDAHVVVIGVGRTGSLLCDALASSGVDRLTLIDPDVVEPHNVGEGALYTQANISTAKPIALAGALSRRGSRSKVRAACSDVDSWSSVAAVADADIVVACVDNEEARRTAGSLSALFHRPLVDIGTGVLAGERGPEIGFDVRLIVPGDGCALCWAALAQRASGGRRLGSLRSLNTVAVGVALRLIEDLYSGAVHRSQHVHGTWVRGSMQTTQRARIGAGLGGCFCALGGRGGRGLIDAGQIARRGRAGR